MLVILNRCGGSGLSMTVEIDNHFWASDDGGGGVNDLNDFPVTLSLKMLMVGAYTFGQRLIRSMSMGEHTMRL